MNAETPIDLWDQLEQALAVQAQALRRNRWQDLESALDRGRAIVDQIIRDGKAMPESHRQQLLKAYRHVILIAEAQKETTAQQLRRLRSGQRTLSAYRRGAGVG